MQIHRGGEALRQTFHWEADGCAKLACVRGDGVVLARHDAGPFSNDALAAFLRAQGVTHL